MSVALLMRKGLVEICDELEAFFYVTLYYAARYLRSNYSDEDISRFIIEFFDTYTFANGAWCCGTLKSDATSSMFLGLAKNKPIVFASRGINQVLGTFLAWLHSQYVVNTYDAHVKAHPRALQAVSASTALTRKPGKAPQTRLRPDNPAALAADSDDSDSDSDGFEYELAEAPPPEPTQEDRTRAAYLESHRRMMKLVGKTYEFVPDDRIGDRMPPPTKRGRKRKSDDDSHPSFKYKTARRPGINSAPEGFVLYPEGSDDLGPRLRSLLNVPEEEPRTPERRAKSPSRSPPDGLTSPPAALSESWGGGPLDYMYTIKQEED